MAKRFSGEFSPDADPADGTPRETVSAETLEVPSFRGRSPMRHGAKINMLFALPLLMLLTVFFQPVAALATDLIGGVALLLGAWLTRDGVRAEDAFMERKVARRPAIPRKIFGSVATGLGVGLLVFGGNWQIVPAVLMAVLAGGLHLIAFGLDPLKNKGVAGADRLTTERVARKVEEAETVLDEITDIVARTRDRQIAARVEGFALTARQMFRQVEADPRDLAPARRYLGVYLQGARDATDQFADIYTRNRDPQIRADYMGFLDDLETNFAKRNAAMLTDDRTNFDVEIEVLQDRLNRENRHIQG